MQSKTPTFPQLFVTPLRLIPRAVHAALLPLLLNRVFAEQCAEGELDFLAGRCVQIRVIDASLAFSLTVRDATIEFAPVAKKIDLKISGSVYDFLLLLDGREDPDTLFFQRRLLMEGDTQLGVHLKNMLAAVDPDSLGLPGFVRSAVAQGLDLYERIA